MSRFRPAAGCILGLLVSASGCGGEGTYRTERPILRISLDEYRIVPQNIVARSGRTRLDVRNDGRLTHNLVVQIPRRRGEAVEVGRGEAVEVGRTETMQPGETGEPIKLTLRPGDYRLVCTIANHDDLGQFGKLEVRG
jgi:uncharacterized cupredoxin-like copper-binding protein